MKKIEGFENYSIKENGEIWSHVINRNIKHQMNRNGYPCVKLCKNGKKTHKLVHRLVAITYLPNPENKKEINHIDGDKMNCNLSNLEWATRKENASHSWRIGLQKHSQNRLNAVINKIYIIILDLQTGIYYTSIAQASRAYNIHPMSLREMLYGKYKNKTTLKIV